MPRHSAFSVLAAAFLISSIAYSVDVPFSVRDVDLNFDRPFRTFAADIDGDGDKDILVSTFDSATGLYWYENDGQRPASFTKREVDASFVSPRCVSAADVDGDGDIDVIAGKLAAADELSWFENDGQAVNPSFTKHTISTTQDDPYRIVTVDLDCDGDLDLAVCSSADDTLIWYENDGAPMPSFSPNVISTAVDNVLDVKAADIDGDGDIDLATATSADDDVAWYRNDGNVDPSFAIVPIATSADAPQALALADVDLDGHIDIVVASSNSEDILWYENDGSVAPSFTERMVAGSIPSPVDVHVGDVDCDGDMDIIASDGGPGDESAWYESDGASPPVFTKRIIESGLTSATAQLAHDMDRDGDLDFVFSDEGGDTVKLYENRFIHRDIELVNETTIDDTFTSGPAPLAMGDIDGDGDLDFAVGEVFGGIVAWYENDGAGAYARRTLFGANATVHLLIADLDKDGDADILIADIGNSKVTWFESDGASPPGFTSRDIDTSVTNVRQVAIGDIDGDGDLDVAAGAQVAGEVRWYESDGASPPAFTVRIASSGLMEPAGVALADVNGDGSLDIVACDMENRGTEIAYLLNDGMADPSFASTTISSTIDGHTRLHAADMDNDGDVDVVAESLNTAAGWYENDGMATFTYNPIAELTTSRQTVIADFDKDGDYDIVEADAVDQSVNWYENDGQRPAAFTRQVESLAVVGSLFGIGIGDIDGDYDCDAILAYRNTNAIHSVENVGGQYTIAITGTGVTAIGEDTTPKAIFAAELTNNGVPGDKAAYFGNYKILYEEAAADPLTTGELAGMLDNFFLVRDNGAGVFDILGNDLIQEFGVTPSLTAGVQDGALNIDFDREVEPGETETFYFAVDAAAMAASASPNEFIATLQGAELNAFYSESPNASAGSVLLMGNTPADVSTGTIIFGMATGAVSVVLLNGGPTMSGPAQFMVTFGEDVAGFDSENDLVITETGTASHSGVSITGGPVQFNVEINNLSGDGMMTLAVTRMSDVQDLEGIPLEFSQTSAAIIIDNTAPAIMITGDNPATHEAGTAYADAGATALDGVDGDVSGGLDTVSTVDDSTPGVYSVTYTVVDSAGNVGQAVRTVNVVDTTPPTIALTDGDLIIECGVDSFAEPGFSAMDTVDGDLEGSVIVGGDAVDDAAPGTYTITYDVMDSSGNAAVQVERVVTVQDTIAPEITILGDSAIEVAQGSTYNDAGATAEDLCDGDLTGLIDVSSDVDTSAIGDYTVTYTVSDMAGNESTAQREVTVVAVPEDLDGNGVVNSVDVQLMINTVLGLTTLGLDADVNGDGKLNSVDIQTVIIKMVKKR